MSFFGTESRQSYSPPKIEKTGPGCYAYEKNDKKNQVQGYAPFGSLENKKVKIRRENCLGPGQYQIRSEICKPTITKYQNTNCIIIKINEEGWSQFKSKTNRFEKLMSTTGHILGPGQYQLRRERPKSESKQKLKSSIAQKIKLINWKNYIQRRKPSLFSDPADFPAEESPKKPAFKGASWSLNKRQRFEPLEKQYFLEEHREQLIQKMKDDKTKSRKKANSAVFASKSLKSHLQAQIYQTSNPFKVQLRKMINYKDERPGPGAYNHHQLQDRKRTQFNRHQFFGSTVQRFQTSFSTGESLGPGCYSPKVEGGKKSPDKKYAAIPQGQQDRHSYIPENMQNPGPGAYSVNGKRKHKVSCKWVFGSKKARFSQQSFIQCNQQQPDQHELLIKMRKQKQYEYRKEFLKKRNQSNFASTSKRFQQSKKVADAIPIGHYDTCQTDIAHKIKKAIKKQKELLKFNRHAQSVPFMSSVHRFKTQTPGQDQHAHLNCWCLVKSVEKQVYEHQSSAFSSKYKRIAVFEDKNARNTPAVGTYTKQSSFVKGSFNSRFLKANQCKQKKIKMWNTQRNRLMQKKPNITTIEEQINLLKVC